MRRLCGPVIGAAVWTAKSRPLPPRRQCSHGGCRLGHDTRHFNVGQYRRKQRGDDEIQDASFFDHKNPVHDAQHAALVSKLVDVMQHCHMVPENDDSHVNGDVR